MAKKLIHPAEQYATDVMSGKISACKWVRFACERYFYDLKLSDTHAFEYYFDRKHAQRYIDFIQILRLTKGEWAGKPFVLQTWQQFIAWNLFGWKRKSDDCRRFIECTVNVPKKNGKTEFAAGLSLAVAWLDQEYGGQIYMAATAREQAALCWQTAKDMVRLTPHADKYFETLAHSIVIPSLSSFIKAISSEASTAEGKGASCVVFDEEHEQLTNSLRDNLVSGMAARRQPLFISISTAGTDRTRPYYKHIQKCKSILEGTLSDERHFIVVYTTDEGDDWEIEDTWSKANPNYGLSVKSDFLKKQYTEIKNEPSKQPNFLTKHLDIWTDAHSTWVPYDVWMKGKRSIKIEDYYGRECWMGLDLASSMDFTALAIMIPDGDKYIFFWKFWIPKDMADKRTKRDKIRFIEWASEGWITLTEGNVTDYDFVEADIKDLCKHFSVKKIAYDDHNSQQIINHLVDTGIEVEPFSQSITSMSAPTKEFERLIMGEKVIHNGNPVMSWMMGNVQIFRDANDNKNIHRGKSTDKVDGPIASVNALGIHNIMPQEDTYWVA
jgi:phage terminase large subunit-like protein